jgi:hypothetical protein
MKKTIFIFGLSISMLLVGCAKEEGLGEGDQTLRGTEMDNTNQRPNEEQRNTQFGYVRYSQDQLNTENVENLAPEIDREETANMITKLLIQLRDIKEAATLITDSHALVAYTREENVDRNQAADSVKKTVQSIIPRWFHVYISDQPQSYKDLQALGNNTVMETGSHPAIEEIIKRFRAESPQGGDYNEEDNIMENGE